MSTWIKSDERLANHPKVDLLATTLDIHPAQALGHLHYIWYFGLNYADDGDLTRYRRNLSKAAKYDGDNDEFVTALIDTGWLDENGKNLHIHDWLDYHGALLDQREKDRDRKRKEREIKKEVEAEEILIEDKFVVDKETRSSMFQTIVEVWLDKSYTEAVANNEINSDVRGQVNRALKILIDENKVNSPDEIARRAVNYFIRYGERPTPQALTRRWPEINTAVSDQDRRQAKKNISKQLQSAELESWAQTQGDNV